MELEIRFCYLASASSVTPKSPPLVLASVNAVRACNFKCSFKLQYCDISWFIMVKTVDKNNLLQPTHFHPPLTPICTIISTNSIHIFHLFVEKRPTCLASHSTTASWWILPAMAWNSRILRHKFSLKFSTFNHLS